MGKQKNGTIFFWCFNNWNIELIYLFLFVCLFFEDVMEWMNQSLIKSTLSEKMNLCVSHNFNVRLFFLSPIRFKSRLCEIFTLHLGCSIKISFDLKLWIEWLVCALPNYCIWVIVSTKINGSKLHLQQYSHTDQHSLQLSNTFILYLCDILKLNGYKYQ